MAKPPFVNKVILVGLGIVIAFLTWFIRLITFFGDITIWLVKKIIHAVNLFAAKLNFDIRRKAPQVAHKVEAIIRHRVLYEDRNFKVGLVTVAMIIAAVWFFTKDLPSPKQLETRQVPQTTKIYDRNEKLLYNIYTDQNRTKVALSEIPENLKHATIAIEDKDFYKHKGFDIYGIARAARKTLFEGSLQGGSTITQQLVKSAFLTPERTIDRKIKELYLAFRVEMAFDKDRILEMYMNQVPYGGTAWGVAAAAEQYFGKSVSALTLAESAMLAGLPAAPTYYSPFGQDAQRAKDRQKQVLRRMTEDGYISKEEADTATLEKLAYRTNTIDIKAPHFVMFVREYLAQKYGETVVDKAGLKVTTTLDLDVQEKAQEIVRENIEELERYRATNGAALVASPKTGEILAMVGSRAFFDVERDGNVNVTIALRQPGSAIKPINYATALNRKLITPATVIIDVATTFSGGPVPYRPVNYDGRYHGPVQVRFALANSYNIPAVKVLALNGVGAMIEMARKMGIRLYAKLCRFYMGRQQ